MTTMRHPPGGLAQPEPLAPPPPLYTGENYVRLAIYTFPLLVVAAVAVGALWYFLITAPNNLLQTSDPPQPLVDNPLLAEMPRLPDDVAASIDHYRNKQLLRLHSFGWVDREAGVGHIPIDEAIKLLAEQGLPTR
jgi:hypothetical protein